MSGVKVEYIEREMRDGKRERKKDKEAKRRGGGREILRKKTRK